MQSSSTHDPESEPNPELSPWFLDPFAAERDHANQWDVSSIWHPEPDSKPESFDWDLALEENAD